MFTDEIEVLEVESDAIKNFEFDLPKESQSARKRAEKMATNNLFEDMNVDDIIVIGSNKKETKSHSAKFAGGVGLTTGLDFSKLADENPEWKGIPIILADEETDLLFSKFFLEGDQNEETRNYRKNKKEQEEFEDDSEDDSED